MLPQNKVPKTALFYTRGDFPAFLMHKEMHQGSLPPIKAVVYLETENRLYPLSTRKNRMKTAQVNTKVQKSTLFLLQISTLSKI